MSPFEHAPAAALRRLALCAVVVMLSWSGGPAAQGRPTQATTFADRIAALSEGEGYFDTDNLISNERRYLSVLPEMKAANVRGGAYIGVGPDQNFSYIAAIRPDVAIMVDIRRDNLLLHLLFKALFAESRTRVEYLALLAGRAVPADVMTWGGKSIQELVAYVDATPAPAPRTVASLRARLTTTVKGFGVPVSPEDVATIDRFHRQFIDEGLGLQFRTTGRAPQAGYPTLRQLLLATDEQGRQGNYLASEDGFQFLKSLQARDLVIPIVGNLAGPSALRAVGAWLRERQQPLSAFYASNVEFYLRGDGSFPRFIENLNSLPRAPHAVIIRSVFGGGTSVSETQPVGDLLAAYARGR